MRIGIDFDNTTVLYDALFRTCALEQGLVGPEVGRTKRAVRDAIRRLPRGNDRWTELQGLVYGRRILEATPAPGLLAFLEACHARGIEVVIISHKTLLPAAGPPWNLHDAARAWLARHLPAEALGPVAVFLELTLAEKLARIRAAGCTHFIDDLEEVLDHPDFPPGVERILYESEPPAPAERPPAPEGITVCRSWDAIGRHLLPGWIPAPERAALPPRDGTDRLARGLRLLETARGATARERIPLPAGANSAVFRIDASDGRRYVLKLYPEGPGGDVRLARESSFLRLLWAHDIRRVPEPVAEDADARLALYGFVEGSKVEASSIGPAEVEDACRFVTSLQRLRGVPGAGDLLSAAEACFSLGDHLRLVGGRATLLEEALARIPSPGDPVREALALVRERLRPLLSGIAGWIAGEAAARGIPLEEPLPRDRRILTPSDFGFHNILRDDRGRLAFLDFEYAGWDDPAKTLVDFFHQPERPVAPEWWPLATRILEEAGATSWFEGVRDRAALLHPLLGVKWILIMLNLFRRLPEAPPDEPTPVPPEAWVQLERARAKLEDVESRWRNGPPCTT